MKTIIRLFSHCCIYTVLITFGFSLFIKASGELTEAAIKIDQFFVLFTFSAFLALAELLFLLPFLPQFAKWLMHYAVSCMSFCIVFASFGKISVTQSGSLISAIIVFSAIYLVCAGMFLLFHLLFSKCLHTTPNTNKTTDKKESYKNRFQ